MGEGVRVWHFVVVLNLLLAWSWGALAAIDAYEFPDDRSRERYNQLVQELRCPQCLNTNLAGSDSMIAKDLRREIHRMIIEGMDDDAIRAYMHERYGDFILYRPRLMGRTLLLWFGPILLLLVGFWLFGRFLLTRNRLRAAELSEADEARLRQLLKQTSSTDGK
jgi:cytochrome c-type biogenesis protein CcmH